MQRNYRNYLAVLALFITCVPLRAQIYPNAKGAKNTTNHNQRLFTLLSLVNKGNNSARVAKTTGTASRLIAGADIDYSTGTGVTDDSNIYIYSGTRGGDYESNLSLISIIPNPYPLSYDTDIQYSVNPLTSVYQVSVRSIQAYDAQNRVISQTVQFLNSTSTWVNANKTTITYNGADKIDTETSQSWDDINGVWINLIRQVYGYDAANNELFNRSEGWDMASGTYLYSYMDVYTYDTRNNIIAHSSENWTTSWEISYTDTYSYNNNNLPVYSVEKDNSTGTLTNEDSFVYIYNSSNILAAAADYTWSATNSYIKTGSFAVTMNAANKPSFIISAIYDANTGVFTDSERIFWTYNSFNQTTSQYSQTLVGSTWSYSPNDFRSDYYYESYTTGVQNVQGIESSVTLSPVPANDKLDITINFIHAQSFTVAVYDAAGRVVTQWNETTDTTTYHKQLSTLSLPAGVYCLRVNSSQGSTSKLFSIQH